MNWKILLSSIVILMTLTACSSSIREIMTVKTEVKKPSLNLPNPDPLVMKEVNGSLSLETMQNKFLLN